MMHVGIVFAASIILTGAFTSAFSSLWCGKVLCRVPKEKYGHQFSLKPFDSLHEREFISYTASYQRQEKPRTYDKAKQPKSNVLKKKSVTYLNDS